METRKIKYPKYFRLYDVLNRNEPYMPQTDEEWENLDENKELEVEINYEDIKMFSEIWWEDFCAYCYGNEYPLLYAFKQFFDSLEGGNLNLCYDYQILTELYNSEELCWAILTILHKNNFIDWGTSIRFGWLDYMNPKALKLKEMFDKYNLAVLYEIIHLDFHEGENGEHIVYEQGE